MEQKDEMATSETVENEEVVCVETENEQVAAIPVQETPVTPAEPVIPATTVAPAAPVYGNVPTDEAPKKPANKKKIFTIIGVIAAVVVAAVVILFVTVIHPNSIYQDACEALEDKKFTECQELLDQIPNHKDTPALKRNLNIAVAKNYIETGKLELAEGVLASMPGDTEAQSLKADIIYRRAEIAFSNKNYYDAQGLLDKIPDHNKTPALKRELNIAIAENYIETGDLDLAESILASMPGDADAQSLKSDIIYKRAGNAITHKKYDEAQEFMDKIPNHEDPENLRAKLTYQDALQCIEQGDYETGYEMMSSLGDYEDAVEQKEMMYYEALAFVSLLEIQSTLKNPASMRVTDVGFYIVDTETTKDFHVVHEITASNSYGGNVGGYVYDYSIYEGIETGNNNPGMMDHSSYVDPDNDYEALEAALILFIMTDYEKKECSVDVARMNRLLENKVTFKIELDFQSTETVDN